MQQYPRPDVVSVPGIPPSPARRRARQAHELARRQARERQRGRLYDTTRQPTAGTQATGLAIARSVHLRQMEPAGLAWTKDQYPSPHAIL